MAEEKKPIEKPVEKKPVKAKLDVEKFIARKLKAINEMNDEAKAKELAERVMRNKRGK